MGQARFEIAFEGVPFDDGSIDVSDLAPTLLALGKVVQMANQVLNGDRAEAKLKVAATSEGSFVAALLMDVSWITDMLDAVVSSPGRVVAADQLMDLLIKAGTITGAAVAAPFGLFAALKKMNGRRPDLVEPTGNGTTEITINGTVIVVDDRTVDLLRDLPLREAVENFSRKAASVDGLERLRLGSNEPDNEALILERRDFSKLEVPDEEDIEIIPDITRREAWLKIVSVHFRDGYKWRFSDGGERPFTAEMEDIDFLNRVQEGFITMNANDAIRCRLRDEQSLAGSSLSKSTYVEEVLEHRPGARQMALI
jgi:hypothetical protein